MVFHFRTHVYKFAPAAKIIVQQAANFWASITLNACENVHGSGQFAIVDGGSILFWIDQKLPFGVPCVLQIVIDAIAFLLVDRLKYLSAAVITLHSGSMAPL